MWGFFPPSQKRKRNYLSHYSIYASIEQAFLNVKTFKK
jgi:hypothetical protein